MTARADRLLREIESGALDHQTPIGDVLRKAIALGGRAGSAELRDWATRELRGYGPEDELPDYRKITAPLQYDMINMRWHITGRSLSSWEVPECAREKINNDLQLRMGIGEIEKLARKASSDGDVKLLPPGAPDLVAYMNRRKNLNGHLELIYWSVSATPLEGVVDQVRTTLTVMIAEINATLPEGSKVPSAEVATNAYNVAITGKRNKINLAAPQGGSTVSTGSLETDEQPQRWLRIGGVVLASGIHRDLGLSVS